ncbi:TPA: 2Fe-2S iron-sulfur cluster-binding protein [Providencia stuartii]|uniref:PDR/VanB family oxidoreductase n=3 Tax=Providencia stuartii TaxID=588 RepID=A0AAJ1JDK3_PROST|nr:MULTISPECIES: PDR/VanB family oxidoreductase [Providencia]SST03608.1 Dioxygenase beta subunit [Acinetobacter baumannii]AFH93363.1 diogenase subunit beta [Providencia stuartii MRSN 2154]AIN63785.1 2Fe-2S iron-sulfur cluster binding domain protein [Providencia stuartii]AMG68257.1 oxidoreductase [Providencia stuartii]APG51358.1 diogenase subunit beta [Providencia stuartii]
MSQQKIAVNVSRIEQLSPTIKMFEFVAKETLLEPFSAGSHITVHMNEELGLQRAYSLISDPKDCHCYRISVLRDENSKGGSAYMHEQLAEGDLVYLSPAQNYFSLKHDSSCKHILIAGGIGITPFLSYLYELEQTGMEFELHYCFRDQNTAAFVEQLQERLGERLYLYDNAKAQRLSVEQLVKAQPKNSHVYVCGPESLINAVIEHGNAHLGESQVHFENFGEVANEGEAFEVYFQRSGFSLNISEDVSILQAIEADKRIQVECLCRNGVCGTCETAILEGEADHRDHYLDDDERAEQKTMMLCVSRAKTKRLVLDL